jgi:hypothetical protein
VNSKSDCAWSNLDLSESLIDEPRLNAYRLARIQLQLQSRDLAALIAYDPVNIRYARHSTRQLQLFSLVDLPPHWNSFQA